VGKANGSREWAPDDKLRVPANQVYIVVEERWWARRKSAFAHPTQYLWISG